MLTVALAIVLSGCGQPPGAQDLDDMQTALWRARQAVQSEQPQSLLAALQAFERASERAESKLTPDRHTCAEQWTTMRKDMKQLLASTADAPMGLAMANSADASTFVDLQNELERR